VEEEEAFERCAEYAGGMAQVGPVEETAGAEGGRTHFSLFNRIIEVGILNLKTLPGHEVV